MDDSELMEEFEIYVDAHHFGTRKNIADAQLFYLNYSMTL